MAFKLRSSGLPFKELGSSPAKNTEEEAGYKHQHPHTKKEQENIDTRKAKQAHERMQMNRDLGQKYPGDEGYDVKEKEGGDKKESPAKQAIGGGAGEAIEHHKKYKANKPKWDPTKRQGGDWIKEARKQKAASTKSIFPEHVKIVKSRGKSLVKKGLKKAGKFLGGKALGVGGMMMATSSKADQPKKGKGKVEYEGGKIDFTSEN
jgi:hypothetical protein